MKLHLGKIRVYRGLRYGRSVVFHRRLDLKREPRIRSYRVSVPYLRFFAFLTHAPGPVLRSHHRCLPCRRSS